MLNNAKLSQLCRQNNWGQSKINMKYMKYSISRFSEGQLLLTLVLTCMQTGNAIIMSLKINVTLTPIGK